MPDSLDGGAVIGKAIGLVTAGPLAAIPRWLWEVVGGMALVLLVGWSLHSAGYRSGVAAERREWQKVATELRAQRANVARLSDALAEQKAAMLAAAARGDVARAETRAASLEGDKAKASLAATLKRLRETPPPTTVANDAQEAIELGRAEWSALR